MAEVAVRCPHCQSEAVVKYGKSSNGKERFRGQQREPCGRTFLQTYAYSGCLPTVKQRIVEMTLKGSGIRDIARVLQVGCNTVLKELKKSGKPLAGKQKRRRRMLRTLKRAAIAGPQLSVSRTLPTSTNKVVMAGKRVMGVLLEILFSLKWGCSPSAACPSGFFGPSGLRRNYSAGLA